MTTHKCIIWSLAIAIIVTLSLVSINWTRSQAQTAPMTPGMQQYVDRELGKQLLYDAKHKLVVSCQFNTDGSARVVHIAPDPLGTESVGIDYQLSDGPKPGVVSYLGPLPTGSDNQRSVCWVDLNGDGAFDKLYVRSDHNELLNLDRGVYILLDGKWAKANAHGRHAGEHIYGRYKNVLIRPRKRTLGGSTSQTGHGAFQLNDEAAM